MRYLMCRSCSPLDPKEITLIRRRRLRHQGADTRY